MRTTAQMFRDVIAGGLHAPGSFMCNSLDLALGFGFISGEEFAAAKSEIVGLMTSLISIADPTDGLSTRPIREMSLAYINSRVEAHENWTDWNRFKMYQNWENRWTLYASPPGPSPREFVSIVRALGHEFQNLHWHERAELIEANKANLSEIEYEYARGVLVRAFNRPIISVIVAAEAELGQNPDNQYARKVREKARAMRCNTFNTTLDDLVSLGFKGRDGIMNKEEMSQRLTQVWYGFTPTVR